MPPPKPREMTWLHIDHMQPPSPETLALLVDGWEPFAVVRDDEQPEGLRYVVFFRR